MTQLRLTKKLQTQMGLRKVDLSDVAEESSLLGAWYANVFYLDRRKVVMFINEKSLFQVFYYGMKKKEFLSLDQVFVRGVTSALESEGFQEQEISIVLKEMETIQFTATNSPKTLGHLKEAIYMCETYIPECWDGLGQNIITKKLNRVPKKYLLIRFSH